MTKKIKIITDQPFDTDIKSSMSLPGIEDLLPNKLSEVTVDKFKSNIESSISELLTIFSGINTNSNKAFIDTVKFNVSIDAKGEVAIVSLLKGGISSSVGIEFTIKFKE